MTNSPKDFLPIIAGIISGPEPTDEARQPTKKSKSDRDIKTQIEEKSEGVKFYELDDKEEIISTGNDPIPQITMPSFKKRVHSQRLTQQERAAVTPYEGVYDEKYSSDDENMEYDVCEPEDMTERSNSTVTFSEDIYDSDAIDEMIKNQIRKASQISGEGSMKFEEIQNLKDGSKLGRSILKDGKSKDIKSSPVDAQPQPSEGKISQKTVSPPGKISEGATAEGGAIKPEPTTFGVDKKDEKGEKIIGDVTKPLQDIITDTVTDKETSLKGEREIVTKSLQSTIPLQIDQITDSSATNKHDFAKKDEKLLQTTTKPVQDNALKQLGVLTEVVSSKKPEERPITDDVTPEMIDDKPNVIKESRKVFEQDSDKDKEIIIPPVQHTQELKSEHLDRLSDKVTPQISDKVPEQHLSKEKTLEVKPLQIQKDIKIDKTDIIKSMEEKPKIVFSPTREDATTTAMELIEDITKAVQEVFPEISSKTEKVQDKVEKTSPSESLQDKSPTDKKIQNGGTKILEGIKLTDTGQLSATTSPQKIENVTTVLKHPAETGSDKSDASKISEDKKEMSIKPKPDKESKKDESTTKLPDAVSKTEKDITKTVEKLEELPQKLVKETSVTVKEAERGLEKISKELKQPSQETETVKKSSDAAPAGKKPEETDKSAKSDKVANGVVKTVDIKSTTEDFMLKSAPISEKDAPTVGKTAQSEIKDSSKGKDDTKEKSKTADILVVESSEKKDSRTEQPLHLESKTIVDSKSTVETLEKSVEEAKKNVKEVSEDSGSEIKTKDELPSEKAASEGKEDGEGSSEADSKPRVIFRIDSEDELQSDADSELLPPSNVSSPTEFTEKVKRELKESLEKDQIKLEERLTSLKGRIFDISDESLSKTKELVDERLRKISEIKPPQEPGPEEPVKKEKSPSRTEEIKIGRFHITPALVEEVINRTKEHQIAERLRTARTEDEARDEVEKELPEKLTEADLEEVIRELKKEGLKTDVYLQPEDAEKEEKKERTLKRVERRFERMASETLEKEKEEEEEGVSEEKLNEKREIEFQRVVSNLSSEEVAEYQQEYLQLWEEGGLSSLTPTDDWESRDPDTPENELDDDSPRKSESFRGPQGTGESREPIKSSEPQKGVKPLTSPPKPPRFSNDISPKAQPLTPVDPSHVGSSPSEIDQSSGFVSERSDDIPTYSERKKFWEQMSSSQSSETELPRSMIESVSSVESVEIEKSKESEETTKTLVKSVKQKFEKEMSEISKPSSEEGGIVKSLTESYSKKIAAGELIMPAIPRPKSSVSKDSLVYETEQIDTHKLPDSSDTAVVSELEVKLKSRDFGAPITEAVVPGSTELVEHLEEKREFEKGTTKTISETSTHKSTDSETEFISKYGVESVAFDNVVFTEEEEEEEEVSLPLSERKKIFEDSSQQRPPPVVEIRKSVQERSMSLPTSELPIGVSKKKKYFEEEMKKEMIVEQIMTQEREPAQKEEKVTEKKLTPEIEEAASIAMTELLSKGVKIAEETLRTKEKTTIEESRKVKAKIPDTISLKESHEEKSETEGTEKEKIDTHKYKKKEEEFVPSITVTGVGKRQPETASIGESEDTQSESDVTPEDARVVDNGDAQWDGSGTQSGGFSPKDDIDYPKELGETGIGRWIGQEDLSKPTWEKDDLDSSHFKIQTKWERTRSEGASPKEHFVCTPEEHYPDTVWEVPVQEQLEKEEITHEIPIEKQVIIEKDEEEYEEEEEKIKLTEEEAKEIAEEILEYIQFEVENRSSFLVNDVEDAPEGITQAQVTDYLRHLTGGKEFDDQDVELIESILAKKQKGQFWKSQTVSTTGCSVDITDEELRSSGADNDMSPVESQIMKMQNLEEEDYFKTSTDIKEEIKEKEDLLQRDAQTLKDVEIVDQTLAEVKESLEAAQEQLLEQHKKKLKSEMFKKESPSEFEFKGMTYEKKITEAITEQSSEWEKKDYETTKEEGKPVTEIKKAEGKEEFLDKEQEHLETIKTKETEGAKKIEDITEESLKQQIQVKKSHEEESSLKESEKEKIEKRLSKDSSDEEKRLTESQQSLTKTETIDSVKSEKKIKEKIDFDKDIRKTEETVEKIQAEGKTVEQFDLKTQDKEVQKKTEKEILEKDTVIKKDGEKIQKSSFEEKEEYKDSLRESGKTETKTVEEDSTRHSEKSSSMKTEILKTDSKIQKSVTSEIKTENEELKNLEISVPETMLIRKIGEQIYSSGESPRSTSLEESMRSPPGGEEMLSSTSSLDKQGDNKSDIVFRHSSSTFLKTDRRSGADLELYSSSGESHYHSFEQTSSRPCSSDVEGLLAANIGTTGSSEYESAISHDTSSKQPTSADYQTAVSSLSSRESIKSLDSESSGHLASVEISSDASETLIPSALELDKDIETPGAILLDDDGFETGRTRVTGQSPGYRTQVPATVSRPTEEDFEIISESEVASWAGGVSEDEEGAVVTGEEAMPGDDYAQKMKRSHEMTFQPEPKPIVFSESLDGLVKNGAAEKVPLGVSTDENYSITSAPDERFGSSLEESGSVLSMSLSTTSEPSAMRTVIELSHTDSDKMDGSLTVSATSIDSATREDLETATTPQSQVLTNEMSTSTAITGVGKKTESVTISTSSSDVQGVPCVSTQVTSVSRKSSMVDEPKSESESHDVTKSMDLSHANGPTQVEYVPDYDEVETQKTKKPQGHRRKESTSNFVPTMMWNLSEARTHKVKADITETEEDIVSDKYVYDIALTEKEVKNDEKKEADDSEGYEQSLERDRKISEGEEAEELKYDNNRPQSQTSKTDSDSGRRPVSSVFSEDQPDSELSDLMKQGSSETEREDPLERPLSPEPEEMENKDITPEFSSEAQASVTELELEYSGAYSRRDEYASHVSPIREERSDPRFKETSQEYVEEERVPDGLHSQTSLESTIAEKHELETGEKEILQKTIEEKRLSDVPDITITEHLTPVTHQKFQYPEPKEEVKDKKSTAKTPDTPASTSSRTSSTSTDQGREYNLDEVEIKKFPKDVLTEEKEVSETKDEKESLDSPSSDSFEMLDKPDITDEFVIIEEVGKEAQENDQEGKSIRIASQKKKPPKRVKEEQDVVMSPATKMTDLKYYPSEEDPDMFSFDSDSPPQPTTRKFAEKLRKRPGKEEKDDAEYEHQIEQNKKWLETQFQGEQAAKIMGAYGYEMEFERAPLEDIKEEDLNELDSSSKIGSMGSQKESLGSFGSVKDSFSSTPDYDVLAGRKYFTRSGDHDDVSMSSLQEFELIEKKLMENGKKSGSSSSQDSLSSKKLGTSSKSGQGDDVSSGSLKEFETLENACATVVNMEKKAKLEEAILSEIDEGHESQISESESCETVSAVMKEKIEFDTEEFDKKMFEIDEIIRQAQSNVEKFSEMQAAEKIESIGRGDSYEEVAKVPDLELDMPLMRKATETSKYGKGSSTHYSTQVVTKKKVEEWRAAEKTEQKTAQKDMSGKPKQEQKQSELLENGGKIKSISVDSLEIQGADKQKIPEGKEDTISLDSYKRKTQKVDAYGFSEITHKSDSMEEVSTSLRHHESSSGDYTSSGTDHHRPPPRADFMLGSTDSLDPSSSTATHATYQYETDSVMSSSFTSGDSNTMVSSTDNLDLLVSGQSVIDLSKDLGLSRTDDWLENLEVSGVNPLEEQIADHKRAEVQKISFKGPDAEAALQEYLENIPQEELIETEEVDEHGNVHIKKVLKQRVVIRGSNPKKEKPTTVHHEKVSEGGESFVSETVEPLEDGTYSHIIHKRIQTAPEVQKVVFRGPDAEKALQSYIEQLNTGEDVEETEEVDEHGNVHVKRVIRQRVVITPGTTREKVLAGDENAEDEIVETEEVGEDGTIRIKKIIRKKMVVKPEELEAYEKERKQMTGKKEGPEIIDVGPQVQKIIFKGPNAEKALEEYTKGLKPEDDVLEVEEVDEDGNIHVKKILRQRIVVRPNQELTEEQLKEYLSHLSKSDSVTGEGYSHIVHERVDIPSEVQKVTFKGPDAEKQLQEFLQQQQQQQPEIEEIEEVDEHGNVHIKKVLRQRVVVRPNRELTKQELEEYLNKLDEPESVEVGSTSSRIYSTVEMSPEVRKITFKGPDAEKQLQEFMQQQQPEVEEIEEVDEHGNVHIKKILRQRVVVRPNREMTKQELEQYLKQHGETEGGKTPGLIHSMVEMSPEVQKVTFKGPDAEKQLQEFLQQQQQQPEIEEIEEVDEHGNVHIKKVLRQRLVVRPDKEMTKQELEQYLAQMGGSKSGVTSGFIHSTVEMSPEVQKVTFKGPDAEKQLQEFLQQQQQQPEIEEIEEVDEHGNVHIKKVLRQRVVVRPNREMTKQELEQYLAQVGSSKTGETSGFIHSTLEMSPEVQKVTFKGPDAEKQLEEFMQQQQPEVEEIEEVDEHGNVHVKRIIKQRVFIRPEELRTQHSDIGQATSSREKSSRILSKDELEQYLNSLEEPESYALEERTGQEPQYEEVEEKDEHGNIHRKKVLIQKVIPHDLSQRLLTEEEFQERLRQHQSRQTTVHAENVYIGSTEPFVSEIIEPLDEEGFSHIIHRKVQMAPEVQKVVFRGPNADEALKAYVEALNPGEDFEEVEEVDEDGNIHVKRILRRKIILKPEDLQKTGLTGEELKSYLKQFEFEYFEGGEGSHVQVPDPSISTNQTLTEGFSSSVVLTEKEGRLEEEKPESESSSAVRQESGISPRPPLLSDISMDDEAEYDTTEHDWRHQLEILHAEADEDEIEHDLDEALAAPYTSQKKK